MEQPAQIAKPCPHCSTPIVCTDGKIPSHGRVVGEEVWDCDAAAAGKYFNRTFSKPANREGKKRS